MPRDSAEEPTGLWAAYAAFAGVATGVAAFAAWQLSQAYSKMVANQKEIESLKLTLKNSTDAEKQTHDATEHLYALLGENEKAMGEVQRALAEKHLGIPSSGIIWGQLQQEKADLLAANEVLRGEIASHVTRMNALDAEIITVRNQLTASSAECVCLQQQIQEIEAQRDAAANPQPSLRHDTDLLAAGGRTSASDGSGGPVGPPVAAPPPDPPIAGVATGSLGTHALASGAAQFAVPWAYRGYY